MNPCRVCVFHVRQHLNTVKYLPPAKCFVTLSLLANFTCDFQYRDPLPLLPPNTQAVEFVILGPRQKLFSRKVLLAFLRLRIFSPNCFLFHFPGQILDKFQCSCTSGNLKYSLFIDTYITQFNFQASQNSLTQTEIVYPPCWWCVLHSSWYKRYSLSLAAAVFSSDSGV
jgi:hypothetical protein